MKYFQTKNGYIVDEKHELVPMEEGHPLYIAYLAFLVAGGVVEPTDFDIVNIEEFNAEIKEQRKQAYETDVDYLVNQFHRHMILESTDVEKLNQLKTEIEQKTNSINLKFPYQL